MLARIVGVKLSARVIKGRDGDRVADQPEARDGGIPILSFRTSDGHGKSIASHDATSANRLYSFAGGELSVVALVFASSVAGAASADGSRSVWLAS